MRGQDGSGIREPGQTYTCFVERSECKHRRRRINARDWPFSTDVPLIAGFGVSTEIAQVRTVPFTPDHPPGSGDVGLHRRPPRHRRPTCATFDLGKARELPLRSGVRILRHLPYELGNRAGLGELGEIGLRDDPGAAPVVIDDGNAPDLVPGHDRYDAVDGVIR